MEIRCDRDIQEAAAQPLAIKLSICIGTYNRAAFISSTLESIIPQLTSDCEIVISDNASTDDTERVVSEYACRFDRLRYFRQNTNQGLDRNFDCAVEIARGDYCWLMSDDDLLKPGAVARVLRAIFQSPSLVMVNAEMRDCSMSKVLQSSILNFASDRVYEPEEMDRLFAEVGDFVKYIGAIVVKRSIWLSRERELYYGSMYIHVGMIFQKHLPGRTLVIAEPMVSYREGNYSYALQATEILFLKWPSLVESLALSKSARRTVRSAEPWRNPLWLLLLRGLGLYSLTEYRRWIRPRVTLARGRLTPILVALVPGVLANAVLMLYYSVPRSHNQIVWQPEAMQYSLRQSPFHPRNWRALLRKRARA